MIQIIDKRLQNWGRWALVRRDGDRGIVHGFPYCEPEVRAWPIYCSTPLLDDECTLTDSAVAWLHRRYLQLSLTVELHYRDGVQYSADTCAALMGISRRAYWYRIEAAHIEILGYLTEHECGMHA